jgi:hypothetical protein
LAAWSAESAARLAERAWQNRLLTKLIREQLQKYPNGGDLK